jgi:glycine betaine/proline transport system substrate-binding protein
MKKLFVPFVLAALLAMAGLSFAQDNSKPGAGKTIKPALPTWQSAVPVQAIFKQMLNDLGYKLKDPTPLANPAFYQAVTQDEVDYWTAGWFPLHNAQLPDDFDKYASKVGTIVKNGALQGYLVDKKSAEKYHITSLEDFKDNPKLDKAFDANGDGKADLYACPPGWGCHVATNFDIKAYGLGDSINLVQADYAANFADVLARYRNGKPVLFYTWTPNFTTFKLKPGEDVVWINAISKGTKVKLSDAQKGIPNAKKLMVVSGLKGAVTDPINMGFIANDIRVVANNKFLAKDPAAHELFKDVKIPLSDIAAMTNRIVNGENSDAQVASMASDWISNHQDEVNGWLQDAREYAAQQAAVQ